ncbi:MAG: FAD-dependent oxidoreductase [Anaerolineaceae bacterium]|nr:FAD-dependent oxidoreductase [Anaerolineaceae bacterium]
MPQGQDRQAVVIGAGIAGLLAARVLADHFQNVRVIERDVPFDASAPRKGTPQAHHIHNLLRRGLLVLEGYFPGLTQELVQSGAETMDWTADLLFIYRGGQAPRFPSDIHSLTLSRSLLELAIRRRVAACPGVTFVNETDAVQLLASNSNRTVTGIQVHYRSGPLRGKDEVIPADLVVDAAGRSSRAVDWLADLGCPAPPPSKVQSFTTYATREYERPQQVSGDWKVLLVRDQPPYGTRSGGIYPVEGNRWMVTITGAGKDAPPTDPEGFEAFSRQLFYPGLAEALQQARPLSKIHGFAHTANLKQHFERMRSWPAGLAVTGDAACTFNPLYGQGMAVAALEALELDHWLRDGSPGFQQRVARVVRTPWLIATNQDLKLPETQGTPPHPYERFFQRYIERSKSWPTATRRSLPPI